RARAPRTADRHPTTGSRTAPSTRLRPPTATPGAETPAEAAAVGQADPGETDPGKTAAPAPAAPLTGGHPPGHHTAEPRPGPPHHDGRAARHSGGPPHDRRREQLPGLRIRTRAGRMDPRLRPRLPGPAPRLTDTAIGARPVDARLPAGLLGDPQPHRTQPGRPVLLPGPALAEHRHRSRPDDRRHLARPPRPAHRRAHPARRLGLPDPARADAARLLHQRRPLLYQTARR